MNNHASSTDAERSQQMLGASPEEQAALIMEAGQLHLGRAIQALDLNDLSAATRGYIRVSAAIQEATLRLDLEGGGELAHNLAKLYDWWKQEIMAASRTKDTQRLAAVAQSMGEIRQTWEKLHEMKLGTTGATAPQPGNPGA